MDNYMDYFNVAINGVLYDFVQVYYFLWHKTSSVSLLFTECREYNYPIIFKEIKGIRLGSLLMIYIRKRSNNNLYMQNLVGYLYCCNVVKMSKLGSESND